MLRPFRVLAPWGVAASVALIAPAHAQNFRFSLRAEPDVIPANGLSTTSILVQVPQGRAAIAPTQSVRFATTAGVIESQTQLAGGFARVLLRSSTTPGTATVTAFVGQARETITIEFSADTGMEERYLEVAAPYVAYSTDHSAITSSGKSSVDFGDLHLESDVRLDVDLAAERVWAQGNTNGVLIRYGNGPDAPVLRGDRLFFDLRRRRGVMRRSQGDASNSPLGARQEFVGAHFQAPPPSPLAPIAVGESETSPALLAPPPTPLASPQARENLSAAPEIPLETANSDVSTPENFAAPTEAEQPITAPSTVVPGSLAAAPAPLQDPETGAVTAVSPLVTQPKNDASGNENSEAPALGKVPDYAPLTTDSDAGYEPTITELPPPLVDAARGYWVTARRLRVFPRDKVQFERASIFFNGKRAYSVPLYVLALDGSFNPATDALSFNSEGGLRLKVPFYYQASKRGTGAVFLRREPGAGFGTQQSGPSLEIEQQYWLSPRSHGTLNLDQIGRGGWNLNLSHALQLDNRTDATFFLTMPRHRDIFARAGVTRDLRSLQIGFETFFDQSRLSKSTTRGQFFARMRPKSLGKSGWSYTLSANALGVSRVARTLTIAGNGGGGVGIPGQNGGDTTVTTYRALWGQTLSANLQSPAFRPWRSASFSATLSSTAFNYSDGRRGLAPGVTLGFAQSVGKTANLRLDYTYDRSSLGLYGATGDSFTHYLTASLGASLSPQIGLSAFASRSLSDNSLYGNAGLDYFFAPKWRAGIFTDYSNFLSSGRALNYGWTLGRAIGSRELTLNYDAARARIYFELGQSGY